ncbi:hypothetical protein [Taklimakanibacter deserti]|uniref:hypothetical protein n=1 Tax=Taklimakanibacter deserti TaxID=2267839 RepID=UPI000E65654E
MLVHAQFPIVDFRSFSERIRLPTPGWPAPLPYEEFIRGAGTIQQRPSGGLSGWIAEDKYCDVRRALRLDVSKLQRDGLPPFRLAVAFRRFYFDGVAVGKLEVGFSLEKLQSAPPLEKLLDALMKLPTRIPAPVHAPKPATHPPVEAPLLDAGDAFAKFYVWTTTKHGEAVNDDDVCAGPLSIFVTAPASELGSNDLPKIARRIELKEPGLDLYHWWDRASGQQIHIWACLHQATVEDSKLRNLRVYLLRMNAESHALSRVLKAIAKDEIAPAAQTPPGQMLQAYLNNATRNILGLTAKTRQFAQDETLLAQIALVTESVFSKAERDALRTKMEQLSYRKNIVGKALDYANQDELPPGHGPERPVVNISLIHNLVINMNQQTSAILAFIFGVIFVAVLLAVNILIPNPTPTQYETFRIILALAAGGVGAMIPGILNLKMSTGSNFLLRAGGALAVFVIVYFFQPGLPPT